MLVGLAVVLWFGIHTSFLVDGIIVIRVLAWQVIGFAAMAFLLIGQRVALIVLVSRTRVYLLNEMIATYADFVVGFLRLLLLMGLGGNIKLCLQPYCVSYETLDGDSFCMFRITTMLRIVNVNDVEMDRYGCLQQEYYQSLETAGVVAGRAETRQTLEALNLLSKAGTLSMNMMFLKQMDINGHVEAQSSVEAKVLTEPSSAKTVLHLCMHNQLWMPSLVAHDSLELLESSLGCLNRKRTPQEDPQSSQVHPKVKSRTERVTENPRNRSVHIDLDLENGDDDMMIDASSVKDLDQPSEVSHRK
nr:hypothetical protein [Tanacetum cinerariifolium]